MGKQHTQYDPHFEDLPSDMEVSERIKRFRGRKEAEAKAKKSHKKFKQQRDPIRLARRLSRRTTREIR